MKDPDTNIRVSARTAELRASDGDADDGPPWQFNGVAVAAGDILYMDDGTPVLMTEEELRKAAETQAGEPVSVDHPEDENGRPLYPPPTEDTVGKVQRSGWLEGAKAVGYDATTHDEAIAEGIRAGSYAVSVHPKFRIGEQDPATGAFIARDIDFGDLSVVSKGMSPNASAEWGPNQALASYTQSHDISAELTAAADSDSDGDRQGLIASTVRGTLQAIGIQPAELQADGDGGSTDDEPGGNPGSDNGNGSDTMDRDDIISTLAGDYDFNEEWLEDQDDDVLDHLSESVTGSDDDTDTSTDTPGDGAGAGTDDDNPAVTFETEEDFNQAVDERLEEQADEVVATAQARAEQREKAEEIVARSDDWDEDDLEDLVASPKKVVDREFKRVRGEGAAQFPGNASGLTAAATHREQDGVDRDEYGTGVAGDSSEED